MKHLVLLRHAQAVPEHGGGDFQRPLSAHGAEQAQQAAANLHADAYHPDLILTSPAARTYQTATFLAPLLQNPPILREPALYLATPSTILEILRSLPPEANRVILVGHNPGISLLTEHLLPSFSPNTVLSTGQYLSLTLPIKSWQDL